MILNTYIKKKQLLIDRNHKCWLGKSISQCYKSLYPKSELAKVNISENGLKMSVVDYPKEFLESIYVERILRNFIKKYGIKKQEVFNVKKVSYGGRKQL
jgi:hypothetical protein